MSKQRKIFLAMAAFIVAMSVTFIALTHLVVRESFQATVEDVRGEEIDDLALALIGYYRDNGAAWRGARERGAAQLPAPDRSDASYVLLDRNGREIAVLGDVTKGLATALGFERKLRYEGTAIGTLHYYDEEVANLSKLRLGIPISILTLMIVPALIFILISLLVAYWIARRLTAPLKHLIPAIQRVGSGEYGIGVPVTSKDEFGIVAESFNAMSAELRRTEEVRRSLVADVAHELRTPLTIVQGKLDLLQQGGTSVEPEELLPLQDELIRLTRLVDDLHQLSLAEARKLPIDPQPTAMQPLLERLIERVAFAADDKRIRIELASSVPQATAVVDPNRMTQVFMNLLMNAIRYTPEGGSIEVALDAQQPGTLRIAVRDRGPGIAPEHLPHLFDRFYRTDDSRNRSHGGMGLGLAITKAFVLAHGGSIDVESEVGNGTAFIVRLPSDNSRTIR